MNSDWNVSDLKLSGLQCGELSESVATTHAELQDEIQQQLFMAMAAMAVLATRARPSRARRGRNRP